MPAARRRFTLELNDDENDLLEKVKRESQSLHDVFVKGLLALKFIKKHDVAGNKIFIQSQDGTLTPVEVLSL